MTTVATIAEAFSRHRFTETYPHLAADVRWTIHGGPTVEGRDALIAACDTAAVEIGRSTTEFTRFLTIADEDAAAVDVVARYTAPDGTVTVVASCDVYEFRGTTLHGITSYTVEL